MKRLSQKGFSVVELAIAVLIMGVMVGTIMGARTFMAKQTQTNADKAFATEKAIQMFEELKALASSSQQGIEVLDSYTSSNYDPVLTTDINVDAPTTGVANPLDPLSQNKAYRGGWRFVRKVLVQNTGDDYTRVVYVWVYGAMGNSYTSTSNLPLLAQVTGIVRTNNSVQSPAQVLDVYLLAVQNVQGWWSQVDSLESTYTQIIKDLQDVNNSSIYIRPHYITRLSYGRDPYYAPYVNVSQNTVSDPGAWVYLYPGSVPNDSNVNQEFYEGDVNGVLQAGSFNIDGTILNPYYSTSGSPQTINYSVADQYDDSMRYPAELNFYKSVTQAAATQCNQTSLGVTEISERMLLDGMNSTPQSFANALIVNLHGEMLPMPSMRNYSDAAKDPGNVIYGHSAVTLNGVPVSVAAKDARVVTHPELLYYPTTVVNASVTVRLRVYAYYDGLDSCAVTGTGGVTNVKTGDPELPAISVFLPNYYLPYTSASTGMALTDVSGNSAVTYKDIAVTYLSTGASAATFVSSLSTDPVTAVVSNPTTQTTLITLYNTRLRCPSGLNNTGLNPLNQLYGLEYIPCSADVTAPVTTLANPITFTNQDLSSTTANVPKNTARWILQLNSVPTTLSTTGNWQPPTTGNQPLVIETRIGAGVTTSSAGASFSALQSAGGTITGTTIVVNDVPTNVSQTYAWLGTVPPPYTERFQYTGDPRDCPYLDVKVGGPQVSGLVTIGPCSYNWWFKDITNGSTGVDGYLGFLNTTNAWAVTSGGQAPIAMNEDVPRYLQTLRNGLLATTSIWSTINGWTNYYMGFGGEIGYDQSPFSNSVSYNGTPWSTTKTATTRTVNEIVTESWAGASFKTYKRIPANVTNAAGVKTDMWYAKPWLGELYPDSQFGSFWYTYGNLPTAGSTLVASSLNPVTFYREDSANFNNNVSTYTTTQGFINGTELGKSPGAWGCQSFGGGTPTGLTNGNTLEHDGGANNTQTGTILSLGTTCFSIFGVPLSASVSCTRPWDINWSATGTISKPPEWGMAVTNNGYNNGYGNPTSMPITLSIPAVSGVSRLFYTSDDTNSGVSSWKATGIVQMTNAVSQRAYVLENGLATSAQFGPEPLGKTSLVLMLRTFLDGGLMSGVSQVGHITQLPLVQETTPEEAIGQYQNPQTIHVVVSSAVANTTNVWYRFGGLTSASGNFYTQEYPGYTSSAPLTASTYSEATSQQFILNFKYANDAAPASWYYMSSGAPIASQAQTGIVSYTNAVTVSSFPTTFAWNVSDSTTFPQADYDVRCEVYRQGLPLHYSFHTITLTVDR